MIDPKEAPEGYIAIAGPDDGLCGNCAFNKKSAQRQCFDAACSPKLRNDKENVIFIEIPVSLPSSPSSN